MVLDTGSNVVWLQCAPCRRCYAQAGKVIDPGRSHSYGTIASAAPLCHRLDSRGCDTCHKSCLYQVVYDDGSITAGDFAIEMLAFPRGAQVMRVAIGCSDDNEGLFVAAAELLSLDRGRLSFPTQITCRYGRSFSYCLVDRTSSMKPSSSCSSAITFGFGAVAEGPTVSFTSMVRNPKMVTFYYVRLLGFNVGGVGIQGVAESDLRLNPSTGRGGVILDSGVSIPPGEVVPAEEAGNASVAGGGRQLT